MLDYSPGMLHHTLLYLFRFDPPVVLDRVITADGEAFPATNTFIGQNKGFINFIYYRFLGAPFDALTAIATGIAN